MPDPWLLKHMTAQADATRVASRIARLPVNTIGPLLSPGTPVESVSPGHDEEGTAAQAPLGRAASWLAKHVGDAIVASAQPGKDFAREVNKAATSAPLESLNHLGAAGLVAATTLSAPEADVEEEALARVKKYIPRYKYRKHPIPTDDAVRAWLSNDPLTIATHYANGDATSARETINRLDDDYSGLAMAGVKPATPQSYEQAKGRVISLTGGDISKFDRPEVKRGYQDMEHDLTPGSSSGVFGDSVATHTPEMLNIEHYSKEPALARLLPDYVGTGRPGAEVRRGLTPSVHVYDATTPGAGVESRFANDYRYTGQIPASRVYDISTDPAGLVSKVRARNGGAAAAENIERAVQRAGYMGYRASDGQNPNILKLFEPVDVSPADPIRYKGRTLGADRGTDELPSGNFAVLTAENPNGKPASAAKNVAANASLRTALQQAGYDFTPVTGRYVDEQTNTPLAENSFLVRGIAPDKAAALGRQFKQNSVLTHEGLHDLNSNVLYPSRGVGPATGNIFTQLPDGQRFASDLDFQNPQPVERAMTDSVATRVPLIRPETGPVTSASASVASDLPPQKDLRRFVGPKIPQSRLDQTQDLAYQTYTGPEFLKHLAAGYNLPGGPDWYDTRPTVQKAVDALGDEQGPQQFDKLMDFMAASTARSNPANNLRRATWWKALNDAGLLNPDELRTSTLPAPAGMGHFAQRAHHSAVADLVENGMIDPINNPKPAGFTNNLQLNWRPYTNDTVMSTLAGNANPDLAQLAFVKQADPKSGSVNYSPRDWAYAPMERAAQQAASDLASRGLVRTTPGLDPTAAWQAQVWTGSKAAKHAGSFNDVYNTLLNRTAGLWGLSPVDANRLVWQGHPFDLPLNAGLLNGW